MTVERESLPFEPTLLVGSQQMQVGRERAVIPVSFWLTGAQIRGSTPVVSSDTTKPNIGNFSPPAGTILTKNQSVSFDVTDNLGLFARVIVVCILAGSGIHEVVHDGDTFVGLYAGTSGRSLIANGFSYTVLRSGGWPSAPAFRTFAIDTDGNEAD